MDRELLDYVLMVARNAEGWITKQGGVEQAGELATLQIRLSRLQSTLDQLALEAYPHKRKPKAMRAGAL